jgi:hypothetical protein
MAPISAVCQLQIQFGKSNTMAEHSLWRFSRALHSAINERQPEDIETQIDDESLESPPYRGNSHSVDWVIYGPIELFPSLGVQGCRARGMR